MSARPEEPPKAADLAVWEYMVLPTDRHPNDLFFQISRAGRQGWELVGPVGNYVYLKRALPQEPLP